MSFLSVIVSLPPGFDLKIQEKSDQVKKECIQRYNAWISYILQNHFTNLYITRKRKPIFSPEAHAEALSRILKDMEHEPQPIMTGFIITGCRRNPP